MNYQKQETEQPKKRRKKTLPVFVSEEDLLEILKVSKHPHHKLAYMRHNSPNQQVISSKQGIKPNIKLNLAFCLPML